MEDVCRLTFTMCEAAKKRGGGGDVGKVNELQLRVRAATAAADLRTAGEALSKTSSAILIGLRDTKTSLHVSGHLFSHQLASHV